jgi:murein DD-endopeptidase MepM/ murein hydrolase activator NlpD
MSAKKAKRTVTRLQFTEEERKQPKLKKPIQKMDKASDKLDQAIKKAKVDPLGAQEKSIAFDTLKKPVKLQFEELQVKKPPSAIKSAAVALPAAEVHRQIARSENDNVGVESAHRLEETAEGTARTAQNAHRSHKLSHQRKVLKTEKKLDQANVRLLQKQAAREQPLLSTNPLSRWQQKQAIKKEYAAAKAGKGVESVKKTADTTVKTAKKAKEALEKTAAFVAQHSKVFLGIIGLFFIVVLIMNTFASCSQMAIGGLNAFLTTSYTSSDEDITAADLEYTRLEAELEYDLLNIERDYPGFDEYRYSLDSIGHDPHELIAYLTARFEDFNYAEVEAELRSLFSSMYSLSITETVEVRYRTETRYRTYTVTDPETGEVQTIRESYEVEVPYDFYILNINLSSKSLYSVVYPRMNPDQREMYLVYMDTKGNKQYFGNPFSFNWTSHVTSLYGWRVHPITQRLQIHRGLDLAIPLGTPIQSIHEGVVVRVGYDASGYGHYAVVEDDNGYRSTYAHCSSVLVSEGQSVLRGQEIAKAGSTGASTGSHLHLELTLNGQYLNPYFFIEGTDPYTPPAVGSTNGAYTDYDIPPEALSDPTFAALIKEAEKYLGYPYVWGGSTPETSFDCSGFVCWVFKNSGVYPLSRTTAQGIFDQCAIIPPSEAKPGDIVFFTGTYNSIGPVSHVAIYVGDGMMIHAGNPIQYASMNTSYFQSHFYAFGRLPRR